jgi:autotransporter-associated beta strand protein
VTKIGANTLVLNSANTYSGGTVLQTGTISVGHSAALGSSEGALIMGSNTTLALNGNTISVGSLTGTSGPITSSGGTLEVSGRCERWGLAQTPLRSAASSSRVRGRPFPIVWFHGESDRRSDIGANSNNLVFFTSTSGGVENNMNITGSGNINVTEPELHHPITRSYGAETIRAGPATCIHQFGVGTH